MFKLVFIVLAMTIYSATATPEAKPGVLATYAAGPILAPAVAPAVVTAQSSQVFARNYNGIVSPLVAAPLVRAAPYVAAPIAYSSPYYNPYVASPYVAAPAPVLV